MIKTFIAKFCSKLKQFTHRENGHQPATMKERIYAEFLVITEKYNRGNADERDAYQIMERVERMYNFLDTEREKLEAIKVLTNSSGYSNQQAEQWIEEWTIDYFATGDY